MSEKESKHMHYFYFALVALVAVIGVVVLALFASPVLKSSQIAINEGDLAGEASGVYSVRSSANLQKYNCKLVDFTNAGQTGNNVCNSVGKQCLFSFGSIYYAVKESTDGSCFGDTLWTIPEPREGGMMFQPLECNQIMGEEPELFALPALNLDVPEEWGTNDFGQYCFKGEGSQFSGHDVWVGGREKTKQQALCCS